MKIKLRQTILHLLIFVCDVRDHDGTQSYHTIRSSSRMHGHILYTYSHTHTICYTLNEKHSHFSCLPGQINPADTDLDLKLSLTYRAPVGGHARFTACVQAHGAHLFCLHIPYPLEWRCVCSWGHCRSILKNKIRKGWRLAWLFM